jgi:hypothetical protein
MNLPLRSKPLGLYRCRGYLGLHLGQLHWGINMPRITLCLGVCAKSSEDSVLSTSWGLPNVAHWLVVLGVLGPVWGADVVSTPLSRTPSVTPEPVFQAEDNPQTTCSSFFGLRSCKRVQHLLRVSPSEVVITLTEEHHASDIRGAQLNTSRSTLPLS